MRTDVDAEALDAARHLAEGGVPIFVARPNKSKLGFALPESWELTRADPGVVDRWKPGWALCAVMGHVLDAVDVDPRNGGTLDALQAELDGEMPRVYGVQDTPSGGQHHLVASLGVRKRGNIVPGVDLQAGNPDGVGRGFIFLAPTVRESKADGEQHSYTWKTKPDLGPLLLEEDDSGTALAELARGGRDEDREEVAVYDGPEYSELELDKRLEADALVAAHVKRWQEIWAKASNWPVGHRPDGRGWDELATDCAWSLARMAVCPWTGLDEDGAEFLYREIVQEEVAKELSSEKWDDKLLAKAAAAPVNLPPWEERSSPEEDFDVWDGLAPSLLEGLDDYDPADIASDLQLGKRVAREYLRGKYLAWGKTGWALWDGRRWDIGTAEDLVVGDVREALLHIRALEIEAADLARDRALRRANGNAELEKQAFNAHTARMKLVARLSRAETLNNAKRLARPDLSVSILDFDGPETADLLNCGNGVVDLRTGELLPHDPGFKFTRLTETAYKPGAEHRDWKACLRALPEDVVGWVQRKMGQGATGRAPSDEIVLFMRGGGENGKTTFLVGLRAALGEYYVTVPDKVLTAAPNDHPTEFMTLKGARLAVIEELPGGDWLTGTRLKKAEGSESGMKARAIGQDNVEWVPTHTLIATTNHLIQVTDTDHGTLRRLCDLRFPFTFTGEDRDTGLKRRLREEAQREAALAWLVEGAQLTYEEPLDREHMPMTVRADTDRWVSHSNPVEEFFTLSLRLDPERSVLSTEVYAAYRDWSQANGRRVMSDQTFWDRARKTSLFAQPDVGKSRVRDYGKLDALNEPMEEGRAQLVVTCLRWTSEGQDHLLGSARRK